MYQSNYRPPVLPIKFLNELYNRSISYTRDPREIRNIEKYINYIEDYVRGLQEIGFMNSSNMNQILTQIGKIKTIRSLPIGQRGIYGATMPDNSIYINPDLGGNRILSADERIRLYTFHELGHIVHGMYEQDINAYINSVATRKKLNSKELEKVRMGFEMIDEATVQETAEKLAYRQAHKQRPQLRKYKQSIGNGRFLFGNRDIITNFDYYGELQCPAVMLAKTMRGIGTNESYRTFEGLMSQLSQRSFEPNFVRDLAREYSEDGYEEQLIIILNRMGTIKDAAYGLFGGNVYPDSIALSEESYRKLYVMTTNLTDWRPRGRRVLPSGNSAR